MCLVNFLVQQAVDFLILSPKDALSLGQSVVLHVILYDLTGTRCSWAVTTYFPLPGQLSLYLCIWQWPLVALMYQLEQLITCARVPITR